MEKAVHSGDLQSVEECIRIESCSSDWKEDASLLMIAIEKGYENIAVALLAVQTLCWADIRVALDLASDKELEGVVQKLIDRLMWSFEEGARCEEFKSEGSSQEQMRDVFTHAILERNWLLVRHLLKSGCCVSILSKEEQEALLLHSFDKSGSFVGDMFVVQALLQNEAATVSILSRKDQKCLLFHACLEDDLIVANALITNGCNVNCTDQSGLTPLMVAAHRGHEEIVKKLILANAKVEMQDLYSFTALHYAAAENHIHCGILLVEGGASVRTKDTYSETPLDMAYSPEFRKAIRQAVVFTTRKTLCIIGNAEGGKSTLITALQAESSSILGRIFNRLRRVDDRRKRTAGIEPITHGSQKYGEVLFFDFAGQHEYYGPHQVFLESLLSKPGVSMTLLLVVKVTEEEDAILHQLHRWLSPLALAATTASPPRVIVIGSFLDKVRSKQEATAKLTRCIEVTRKDLEGLPLEFVGSCSLNCRQPQSEGMGQLWRFLEEVPVPEFRATHTQYSLAWVLSQIGSSFTAQAVHLQEFSKWIQDNQHNLPQSMPSPKEVCQDLSAAGHALYIPNMKEPFKSWLVLDLSGILHDVYGTLFSQSKEITNEFGLIHCGHLASLFPDLDVELVEQLLVSLEFCIPVDPSVLKVEMRKLTQSEEASGWLFFPALISAKPPPPISEDPPQQSVHYLCWQLRTSKKHFISAHILQTILLRLAAHFVVQHCYEEGIQQHCCSIWWNGIAWQSKGGVDISVHIANNRIIQVVGMSNTAADKLCQYLSDVISNILSTIHQLSPNLAAAAYIVHPPKMTSVHEDVTHLCPKELFLVEDIRNSIADCEDYTLSHKDSFGHSTRLRVSDLFGGWKPSLEVMERISSSASEHPASTKLPSTLSGSSADPPLTSPATSPDSSTPTATSPPSLRSGAQALLHTSSVPTLSDMTELIVTQVAANWYNFALVLGVEVFLIDAVSKDHKSCIDACQDMLKRWLMEEKHTGKQERTWSTLLTALGRADFGELERSLRREHFYN